MQEKRKLKGTVWNQSSLEESKSSGLWRLLIGWVMVVLIGWVVAEQGENLWWVVHTQDFWTPFCMRFSFTHFHISPFDQDLSSKASLIRVSTFNASVRKDISWLSCAMSEGKCTDWKPLRHHLRNKEGWEEELSGISHQNLDLIRVVSIGDHLNSLG